MNRKIKFRVWDRTNKVMFDEKYNDWSRTNVRTHDYLKLTLDGIIVRQMCYSSDPSDALGDLEKETQDEYILMQFTGLTDKNGVDIYEGDIIKFYSVYQSEYHKDEDKCIAEVYFADGTFRTYVEQWDDGNNKWYSLENIDLWATEVIGNKFQNPELTS